MKCPKCGEKLEEIRPGEGPENKPRYMCPAPDCGFVSEVEELSEDKTPDTP
ncbi:MAG: zinc ribbon domain-containing protein [Rhodobacterales bacterium]|nr:zinc ribbon domain-containing protein [Rhodobacterales bacterium]